MNISAMELLTGLTGTTAGPAVKAAAPDGFLALLNAPGGADGAQSLVSAIPTEGASQAGATPPLLPVPAQGDANLLLLAETPPPASPAEAIAAALKSFLAQPGASHTEGTGAGKQSKGAAMAGVLAVPVVAPPTGGAAIQLTGELRDAQASTAVPLTAAVDTAALSPETEVQSDTVSTAEQGSAGAEPGTAGQPDMTPPFPPPPQEAATPPRQPRHDGERAAGKSPETPTAVDMRAPSNPLPSAADSRTTATDSGSAAQSRAETPALGTTFADQLRSASGDAAPGGSLPAGTPHLPATGALREATPVQHAGVVPSASHEPTTIPARPGQIGNRVGIEIARRVSAGGDELLIRLDPAEMGRVEVRMSFDERGSLRAIVAADSPAALDMLRRESAELGRALNDAGIRSDAQSFRFDSRSGDSQQSWHRSQQGGANNGNSQTADASEFDEAEVVHRPLRGSGQVDLMA